mmetsp:Transcript_22691/g.73441  ORF Transcript_22691/g.73441 Transcript_22691/m.73441 type:complete len:272 (-) Transcript_22691:942-1757(-)
MYVRRKEMYVGTKGPLREGRPRFAHRTLLGLPGDGRPAIWTGGASAGSTRRCGLQQHRFGAARARPGLVDGRERHYDERWSRLTARPRWLVASVKPEREGRVHLHRMRAPLNRTPGCALHGRAGWGSQQRPEAEPRSDRAVPYAGPGPRHRRRCCSRRLAQVAVGLLHQLLVIPPDPLIRARRVANRAGAGNPIARALEKLGVAERDGRVPPLSLDGRLRGDLARVVRRGHHHRPTFAHLLLVREHGQAKQHQQAARDVQAQVQRVRVAHQ